MSYVVDTSVALSAIIPSTPERRDAALALLLDPDEEAIAPGVILAEVAGFLANEVRMGRLTNRGAQLALNDFLALNIVLYDLGFGAGFRLLELGANIAAIDAMFVALAEQLEFDLVTLDDRLIRGAHAAKTTCRVRRP